MLNPRALFLPLIMLCSLIVMPATAQETELAGIWRGSFNINIGGDREFILTISESDGALSAVLDIPAQGMLNLTAESIQINGSNVRFLFPRIDGEYYGVIHSDRATDGQPVRMDGDWSQAGEYIPITLRRTLTD
ncbi:MAG: hypothetical protein Q8L60_06365 [Gammaproteobacteria bacterium]|nr:hypothetical protein [Gammaproteobacteria bacterium]MDP2139395.1 hypothetical protein [Gammaproteobacteria bacterium]MDP2346231.1 hypothetical protein [Gammaproteobacteria bacterium]